MAECATGSLLNGCLGLKQHFHFLHNSLTHGTRQLKRLAVMMKKCVRTALISVCGPGGLFTSTSSRFLHIKGEPLSLLC